MSRHILLSCLLLLTILCAQPVLAQAPGEAKLAPVTSKAELAERVQTILKGAELTQAKVGIHVVDVATGEVLYAYGAEQPLNPASNTKLLTAGAALDLFGPSHTFSTRLIGPAPQGDAIAGDLVIKGDGEGFLLYKHMLEWAAELRARGVRQISGDVVVDESAFPGKTLPPGFEQKDEDASYRAPVGAVSVNFNAVAVTVRPGALGAPVVVELDPPNKHVKLKVEATTAAGKANKLVVTSQAADGATLITIKGTLGDQAGVSVSRKRIDEPALFAGAVMVSALDAVGIRVKGKVRRGKAPADQKPLMVHVSEPLSYVILAMNKWSNNFMAEQLLRAIGARVADKGQDGWVAGLGAVAAFLERQGVPMAEVKLHNGSGLYAGNAISARALTTYLAAMAKHRAAPEFMASLAIAGADGTMSDRLKRSQLSGLVRAKTGTLNEVLSLAGYVQGEGGKVLAFAIIFNDTPKRAWTYRDEQDAIVFALTGLAR